MAKQIAVWGTPESGKTVLATKLALELTEMGKRVAVVYTDDRAPVLPMLEKLRTSNEVRRTNVNLFL